MKNINTDQWIEQLKKGNISTLASAITLVESETVADQKIADDLLQKVSSTTSASYRVGISGAPGAGKSTFINQLGLALINAGHKVAVLAIDPSSEITHGSILGDKTRMEELSREEKSFIRPSSSRGFLGGVHPTTRETIRLCETAGYDVVLVETVGVGQSETAVSHLVDFVILLAAPGAGDELQGIKRGLLERIHAVVVNKADISNKIAAEITEKQFQSALSILRDKKIPTCRVSSIEKSGFDEVVRLIKDNWSKDKSALTKKRFDQDALWLEKYVQMRVLLNLSLRLSESAFFDKTRSQVASGTIDLRKAVKQVIDSID